MISNRWIFPAIILSLPFLVSDFAQGEDKNQDDWKLQKEADEGQTNDEDRVWDTLDAQSIHCEFVSTPLQAFADRLSKEIKYPVLLSPMLEKTPVTFSLKADKMLLGNVLHWVCRMTGTRWELQSGAIFITPDQAAKLDPAEKVGEIEVEKNGMKLKWQITRADLSAHLDNGFREDALDYFQDLMRQRMDETEKEKTPAPGMLKPGSSVETETKGL